MAKKKSKKPNYAVIVPTILSVVFGLALIVIGIFAWIFFNTAKLDLVVTRLYLSEVCDLEGLAPDEDYLDYPRSLERKEMFKDSVESEEDALRNYYWFEYQFCGSPFTSQQSIDAFNEYLESKGAKTFDDVEPTSK